MDFHKLFNSVCSFSKSYNSSKGTVRSSQPVGQRVIHKLNRFSNAIMEMVGNDLTMELSTYVSKGQSTLPRVLWVAFLPRGHRVSTHASIAVCFGRHGEGAVLGVMEPAGMSQRLAPLVNRTANEGLRVDVDGPNPSTKYNNRFINPKEMLVDEFDEGVFLSHIKDSVVLLAELLRKKQMDRSF